MAKLPVLRTTVLVLISSAMVLSIKAYSFPWGSARWNRMFFVVPDDDTEGLGGINGIDSQLKINVTQLYARKRSVDFPSFAYDTNMLRDPLVKSSRRPIDEQRFEGFSAASGSPFVDVNAVSARKTRLLKERSYARSEPFETANIAVPPTLDDLAPPISSIIDKFYVSTPAIIMAFAAAYFTFPFITESLHGIITASEDSINEILGTFAPGISILYGTFVSLTLSILYNRQRTIQDNVAVECSLLTILLRNSLRLFKRDEERIVEAGQCVADQVRTLVRSSRGKELMLLMYSDPYARILDLIDDLEEEQQLLTTVSTAKVPSVGLIAYSRDTIRELIRFRAKRLSDETLALPPTHYFILNILTFLILMCYAISVLPTYDELTGSPPNESSLLFATLSTIYILFYNFANDLNNPFQGVYQVRRSCAASHLLETKWVIANHPLLKEKVDFEEVEEEEDGSVLIRSPGLGDYWFDRDRIYLKHEGDGEDTTNGCDDTLK